MSEITKTLAFVVVGVVAVASAYFIDSGSPVEEATEFVGKTLNNDFDVDAPKRMKISKFNRATATTRQFEVAAVDGVWSIPSKQNYPADATAQMAAAATALIDRKVLRVASDQGQSHAEFGVVDPLADKLDANSAGVGTRVQMYDADDKSLVDMIIGKKVKDSANQRYVRKSNQNVVYVVELDPTSLSTNFDDWIEDDLLKLNPFDIAKVFVNDYSAALGMAIGADGRPSIRVSWDRRNQMTLSYNNDDAKWQVAELKKFDPSKEEPLADALADDEEVNQEALGALRTALDDLKIVDVVRKPAGLSDDLKAGKDFLEREGAGEDLIAKGFAPVGITPDAPPEILSSEGEAIVTLRDGVEYVLRFGKLQVQTESAEGEDPAAADDAEETDPNDPAAAMKPDSAASADKLHRYLFVMARFNEDAVPKPKVTELPPLPEETAEPPATEGAEPAATGDAATPAEGEPAAAGAEDQPAADKPADPAAADKAAARDAIVAQRKLIEDENKREEDRYKEAIETGKKQVAELNERFGDWYYVISDDVYKQIHLGRGQVVKKKSAPAEGAGAPASENPLSGLPGLPSLPAASPATPPAEEPPSSEPPATETPAAEAPAAESPTTTPESEPSAPPK